MPKIVDHDEYRKELAGQALEYFSEHGYTGTSMRKVAAHLGISKSALYHYYPSKEALFLACTEIVMSGFEAGFITSDAASEEEKIEQLLGIMRVNFGSELRIIIEYMRGKSKEEIAADHALQVSNNTYKRMVRSIVGESKTDETLAMIMGTLLLEHMSGEI